MAKKAESKLPVNVMAPKAIAIYTRQSVEKDNSISIETQIDWCKSKITPDERDLPIRIYKDEGKSGGNTDRGEFQKMMRAIRKGKISKVIVYKIDRISRSMSDFVDIWQEFNDYNVKFISAQEAFDTECAYGEMLLKMMILFAELERKTTMKRVKDAYDSRSDKGLYMGGRLPYGFKLIETNVAGLKTKMYEENPEESMHIKYIYDVYSSDCVTLGRVLKALIGEGMETIRGSSWTTNKIGTALRNPIYVKADVSIYDFFASRGAKIINDVSEFDGTHSIYLHGKGKHTGGVDDLSDMKVVIAPHQGFIESSTWLRCQEILRRNKQIPRSVTGQRSWLSGLMVCEQCGCGMTVTQYQDTRYFNCNTKRTKYKCKGPKTVIYADAVENLVFSAITEKILSFKKRKGVISAEENAEVKALHAQIRKIEAEEEKAVNAMLEDSLTDKVIAALNKKVDKLTKEKTQLYNRLESLKTSGVAYEDLSPLKRKWHDATYEVKKNVAFLLIEKIVVKADGGFEIIWKL